MPPPGRTGKWITSSEPFGSAWRCIIHAVVSFGCVEVLVFRFSIWIGVVAGMLLPGGAFSQSFEPKKYGDKYEEEKVWIEGETVVPAFPKPEDLIGIVVSATTRNRFFVDAGSIAVGKDGVVRYTLVVNAEQGATNISHEGIRCETRQRRLYAVGHANGTWVSARSSRWIDIGGATTNRQHAVLASEFLCPGGVALRSAEEGVTALRRGGHLEVGR